MKIKCEICHCEQFVKKNGYFICENCGCKYTAEEIQKIKDTSIENSITNKKTRSSNVVATAVKDTGKYFLKVIIGFIIITLVLGITIFLIIGTRNSPNTNENIATNGTNIFKARPDITIKENILEFGIDVIIYCHDDYETVEVDLIIADENKNTIKTFFLAGHDYKKGNTYTISQRLSVSEAWNMRYSTYSLRKYK